MMLLPSHSKCCCADMQSRYVLTGPKDQDKRRQRRDAAVESGKAHSGLGDVEQYHQPRTKYKTRTRMPEWSTWRMTLKGTLGLRISEDYEDHIGCCIREVTQSVRHGKFANKICFPPLWHIYSFYLSKTKESMWLWISFFVAVVHAVWSDNAFYLLDLQFRWYTKQSLYDKV